MSKHVVAELNLHRLIPPEETATILGVTPGTLSVWRSTGRYGLPFVKSGGRVMYRIEDLRAFIESRTYNGHSGAPAKV